jgi:hypothetical protein
MEEVRWFETVEGTPQGSVISPLLANVYLHYVLDLWVQQWRRRRQADGDVLVIRYADDAVLGFQSHAEAKRFLEQLQERLAKFGLELHPEKTRLIEFGRYATERRKRLGLGKPETFDFLGFNHICGTTRKAGRFTIRRETKRQRMTAKLKEIRAQLKVRRHESHVKTVKWLRSVVRGYFQYHAIPDNQARLEAFRQEVLRMWSQQLQRRSQRSRWNWERFMERLGHLLPEIRVLHPLSHCALQRQISKVRTVCVSSARTGLCGGC